MTKMSPCCARFRTMIARDRGEITRLARIIARRSQKGQDVSKYADQLAKARQNVAETQARLDDHEAYGHADFPSQATA